MRRIVLLFILVAAFGVSASPVMVGTAHATVPGNNGQIAFWSNRDNNLGDIYKMNPDGSIVTNVTNDATQQIESTWSPDGKQIAFDAATEDGQVIYVMEAGGNNKLRITNPDWESEFSPTWSPDGAAIAYACVRNSIYQLCASDAGGRNETTLTDFSGLLSGHGAQDPDWGINGKIAYAFSDGRASPGREYTNQDIYSMNPDSTGQTNLTNTPEVETQPSWSPDGTKIAFTKLESYQDTNYEVYVMNADGSNLTRLTTSPAIDWQPAWSPDGTKIAFSSRRDGRGEIYVMNANGSNQTKITNNPAEDMLPAWQPLPGPTGPQTKADCKDGGYKDFGFENQGQCIKVVNHGS